MSNQTMKTEDPKGSEPRHCDIEKLRHSVDRLSELACAIDGLKNSIPDLVQRDLLIKAVSYAHEAAMYYDELHSFGLYSREPS